MTLTRGLYRAAVVALILAATISVWFWGNQRHAQAEEATLAGQILCYINSEYGPPIPHFNVDECPPPEPPPPPPPSPSVENTLLLCSDGADNDNDALIDLFDSDCSSFLPKLVVVKTVINDNGGTASVSSFSLHISKGSATTTVMSGATTTVASGTWVVGEIADAAYAGTFGGDCSVGGEVTLIAGDTKTCRITNDDIAPPVPPAPPVGGGGDSPSTDSTGSPQAGSGSSSGGGSSSSGGGRGFILGTTTTSVSTTTPSISQALCDRYLTAFIRFNFKNDTEQVRRLQMVLRDVESASVSVNGVYDAATLGAVHALQMKYASDILAPWGARVSTGYVYLTTRKKINELYCRNTKRFELTPGELMAIEQTRAGVPPAPRALFTNTSPAPTTLSGVQTPPPQTAATQEAVEKATGKKSFWGNLLNLFRNK
jgi:hypothetical protein